MNKQEQQYYDYLLNLGYTPKHFPEKHSFLIPNVYLKVCDFPVSDFIRQQAKEASKKMVIMLLHGNLTFDSYTVFHEGDECAEGFLTKSNSKYSPIYYGEMDVEYFPEEAKCIADVIINGKKLVCPRCKKVNKFIVGKNIHYKATCVCGTWITNISSNKPIKLHFGKYAGREISSMIQKEEVDYLKWALSNMTTLKKNVIDAINSHLGI